jgi:ABC-type amino acid transport substrate-binding protein
MKADIPKIDIATDIGFTQLNAWVVRKTSPVLRDSLNAWLRQLKASGKFEEIYNRYYGEAEGND